MGPPETYVCLSTLTPPTTAMCTIASYCDYAPTMHHTVDALNRRQNQRITNGRFHFKVSTCMSSTGLVPRKCVNVNVNVRGYVAQWTEWQREWVVGGG